MARATVKLMDGPPPIPGGAFDLSAHGYVEDEHLLAGEATSYRLLGERTVDGRWDTEPADTAAFTTRVVVRRPANAERFSGTVVVEWLNVSAGADGSPDWSFLHRHLIRRGDAWIGVSAQRAGIEGGGLVDGMHLKKAFPDRYGVLDHPGDAWSFDIFSQAGEAAAAGDVLGPLAPKALIAAGESQSAAFLVTYLNAVDVHATVFDGFFVHSRGATGSGFEGFTSTTIRRDVSAAVASITRAAERIRDDLRVPVVVLQSETDVVLMGAGRAAQPDTDLLRQWEIAGTAHADTYMFRAAAVDDGTLTPAKLAELLRPTQDVLGTTTGSPINAGPQHHYVAEAAFDHLGRWVAGGTPPPTAPRLSLTEEGDDLHRDDHGNALGGLRSPWVDVPTAVLSGMGQTGAAFSILFGTTMPFDDAALARLYPGGVDDYLARFSAALDRTIADGYVLEDDRAEILGLAGAAFALH